MGTVIHGIPLRYRPNEILRFPERSNDQPLGPPSCPAAKRYANASSQDPTRAALGQLGSGKALNGGSPQHLSDQPELKEEPEGYFENSQVPQNA